MYVVAGDTVRSEWALAGTHPCSDSEGKFVTGDGLDHVVYRRTRTSHLRARPNSVGQICVEMLMVTSVLPMEGVAMDRWA